MAKRLSRRRASKRAPPVTGDDRVQALLRTFRAIAEDHLASGGSAAEWAQVLDLLGESGVPMEDEPPQHLPTFETFGKLLELWYSDAAWLTDGEPRALKPRGKAGFAGLCGALGVAKEASSLASLGVSHGILKTTATGDLLPTDRTALVSRPSPMVLELASVGLAAWQRAIRHNVLPGTTKANSWIDRGIYHAPISAALERAYHDMARDAGKQFIDHVDNWLLAHRADPKDPDVRFVTAHLFAATQQPPRARRSGKPRGKR
jgi:hypothetical protein